MTAVSEEGRNQAKLETECKVAGRSCQQREGWELEVTAVSGEGRHEAKLETECKVTGRSCQQSEDWELAMTAVSKEGRNQAKLETEMQGYRDNMPAKLGRRACTSRYVVSHKSQLSTRTVRNGHFSSNLMGERFLP
ncbi:hypothetical protein D3H35_19640 [Cohnella faecalis]|uniref:Uncharacterized protein n=1 Tax=Cohnella faecalis TaxID=2315694 RepID=A0A398CV00_9BACL|nr:hypothetical protein D3H35_19640 [Cohnella faecalis]